MSYCNGAFLMQWGWRLLWGLVAVLLVLVGRRFLSTPPQQDSPPPVVLTQESAPEAAAEEVVEEPALAELSPQELPDAAAYEIPFNWQLNTPPQYACVLSESADTAPAELTRAEVQVSLRLSPGALRVNFEPVADEQEPPPACRASLVRLFKRRQPDGSWHTLRHILLEARPALNSARFFLQLELDATAGTADLVSCELPADTAGLTAQQFFAIHPLGLPEKYRGTPTQRAMLRFVYALAAIDCPEVAQAAAPELLTFLGQLARKAPEPQLPWPRNWGENEPDARAAAAKLTRTLVYLQDNNCFESGELAAVINSPSFERVFGTRFTAPGGRVQEEPIDIIPLPDAQ